MAEPRTLRTHPELRSQQSFPRFRTLGERPKTGLENLLSVFADVRAGEGTTALLLALGIFLLLGAYYLLKPVREALILSESGAEVKSYSAAGQAVLFLVILPLYGWVASKVNRIWLLGGLTVFFMANLAIFWFAGIHGAREGIVFYIWLGIFNILMVSQFWSFANDLYTEGQGRRLFPMIGVGMSVGAVAGSTLAVPLVKSIGLGPYAIMLIAAGVLAVFLAVLVIVNRREKRSASPDLARESDEPLARVGGLRLIRQDRYLLWIAVLIVLLNIVNTTGEYVLGKVVVAEAAAAGGDAKRFIAAFYGGFYSWVNILGLVLQAFVTSRVIRHAGIRGALFVLPILALVSYSVLAVAPVLAIVRWTKVLENSTDYSIMNTVRQALWLPTTREAKYKAKAAIDTFCVRGGDVLQAGVVYVGVAAGAGIMGFAWVNVALTVFWLFAASRIAAEHRKRTL